MSPSVKCLSVRMPRCSFHVDSDRDEPSSMLNATFASLQAVMGSIPFGIDPFNSDLDGMPLLLTIIVIYLHHYLYDIRSTVKESAYLHQSLNSSTVSC